MVLFEITEQTYTQNARKSEKLKRASGKKKICLKFRFKTNFSDIYYRFISLFQFFYWVYLSSIYRK